MNRGLRREQPRGVQSEHGPRWTRRSQSRARERASISRAPQSRACLRYTRRRRRRRSRGYQAALQLGDLHARVLGGRAARQEREQGPVCGRRVARHEHLADGVGGLLATLMGHEGSRPQRSRREARAKGAQHAASPVHLLDGSAFRDHGREPARREAPGPVTIMGRQDVTGLPGVREEHRVLEVSEVVDGTKGRRVTRHERGVGVIDGVGAHVDVWLPPELGSVRSNHRLSTGTRVIGKCRGRGLSPEPGGRIRLPTATRRHGRGECLPGRRELRAWAVLW